MSFRDLRPLSATGSTAIVRPLTRAKARDASSLMLDEVLANPAGES